MPRTRRFPGSFLSNLAILAFMGFALVLSMSDRMPALWRSVVLGGTRLGISLERRLSIDLIDRSDLGLGMDEFGHVVLWSFGMLAIGLLTRSRLQASYVAVALFVTSVALEVGQNLLTTSRSISAGDAIANASGIMAGLTLLVAAELGVRVAGWRPARKLSTEIGS